MISRRALRSNGLDGVLNARRHRDGDQTGKLAGAVHAAKCSTPGGIETVISPVMLFRIFATLACSTPGGIETVIRDARARPRLALGVLNARRHRDGDQKSISVTSGSLMCAQRPEASRR